jgi:potassium efflux system protein
VVIPVGIAYGSDTRLARQVLLKVAADNPRILQTPPPQAMFLSFGDNSLNFELRAFVGSFDHFMEARDDLHMAINDAFGQARIEIAFPQRDIHIRSIDVLPSGAQGLTIRGKGNGGTRNPEPGTAKQQ